MQHLCLVYLILVEWSCLVRKRTSYGKRSHRQATGIIEFHIPFGLLVCRSFMRSPLSTLSHTPTIT